MPEVHWPASPAYLVSSWPGRDLFQKKKQDGKCPTNNNLRLSSVLHTHAHICAHVLTCMLINMHTCMNTHTCMKTVTVSSRGLSPISLQVQMVFSLKCVP